ncbi:MAG: thioesterase domain-containing protein [Oscillospiraceae bacterium]|nr:thioesterase domain-containing protein [Oscillospiraceae bacterium]
MTDSLWFNYCSPGKDNKMNFFCFPHAGSGAAAYAGWGDIISKQFDYFPVQYPMRENRMDEAMPADLRQLAARIATDNIDAFTQKPFVMFGQCLGAYIAYETALQVQRLSGCKPKLLVASGSPSPGNTFKAQFTENTDNSTIAEYFIRLGYIGKDLAENKMYLDFFMPVLRADYILMQTYKPAEPGCLDCPVLAVYGGDDAEVTRGNLDEWKHYISGTLIKKEYCGGHFCINADTLDTLLQDIRDCVKASQPDKTSGRTENICIQK